MTPLTLALVCSTMITLAAIFSPNVKSFTLKGPKSLGIEFTLDKYQPKDKEQKSLKGKKKL